MQYLAMVWPEVPESDGLVHGSWQESVISWTHGKCHHLLVMASKVADVLIFFYWHVPEIQMF